MKKLKDLLTAAFPEAKTQKCKCSDIGIIIPNTTSLELIKTEITNFFINDGYSVVDIEESPEDTCSNELVFSKSKKFVFVIIYEIQDDFYFFVIPLSPKM
jgi:hypothetical protein